MKLTLFQAHDGDCLLVTGTGGETLLADGGRSASYQQHVAPTLGKMAKDGKALDLVYVSHIDNDHISGILQMAEDYVDWVAHDYQINSGNTHYPKPKSPRPPQIKSVWHNAFRDQVGLNLGDVEDLLVTNLRACLVDQSLTAQAAFYDNLITGEKEALRLSSLIGPGLLNIPVNPEFDGGLMYLSEPPPVIRLGMVDVYILGPSKEELERLRAEWNQWILDNKKTIDEIRNDARRDAARLHLGEDDLFHNATFALAAELRQQAELGDRTRVTPPNLASLMLLVEEQGKTILLTGDGHADDIRRGLEAHGKIDEDRGVHVNVLKVQHHGAEYNLDKDFCRYVTADHYLFCANGAHENPDLAVLQAIIDSRLGEGAANSQSPGVSKPFKFWFSSSSKLTNTEARREHMKLVEGCVRSEARRSKGRMHYRFMTRGSKLEISL